MLPLGYPRPPGINAKGRTSEERERGLPGYCLQNPPPRVPSYATCPAGSRPVDFKALSESLDRKARITLKKFPTYVPQELVNNTVIAEPVTTESLIRVTW